MEYHSHISAFWNEYNLNNSANLQCTKGRNILIQKHTLLAQENMRNWEQNIYNY